MPSPTFKTSGQQNKHVSELLNSLIAGRSTACRTDDEN